jgi:hypothetical protein
MTLTELYKGVDLETLNMILEAEGKDYEFYTDEEGEIRCRKQKEESMKLSAE